MFSVLKAGLLLGTSLLISGQVGCSNAIDIRANVILKDLEARDPKVVIHAIVRAFKEVPPGPQRKAIKKKVLDLTLSPNPRIASMAIGHSGPHFLGIIDSKEGRKKVEAAIVRYNKIWKRTVYSITEKEGKFYLIKHGYSD